MTFSLPITMTILIISLYIVKLTQAVRVHKFICFINILKDLNSMANINMTGIIVK